jgi:hypothetical protein
MLWTVRCLGIDVNALLIQLYLLLWKRVARIRRLAVVPSTLPQERAQLSPTNQMGRLQLSDVMSQYEELSLCHESLWLNLGWEAILFQLQYFGKVPRICLRIRKFRVKLCYWQYSHIFTKKLTSDKKIYQHKSYGECYLLGCVTM